MTHKACKEIEEFLLDYADRQLSPGESSQVAAHLAECESCQMTFAALQRSLELAAIIWEDSLAEAETISVPIPQRHSRLRWRRYAAVAASILAVLGACFLWRQLVRPGQPEPTLAEIELQVTESGNAARLLAATELLSKYPEAESIVKRQYRYIVETYPNTTAAAEAKSKIR